MAFDETRNEEIDCMPEEPLREFRGLWLEDCSESQHRDFAMAISTLPRLECNSKARLIDLVSCWMQDKLLVERTPLLCDERVNLMRRVEKVCNERWKRRLQQ